jgi:methionyl-tRNA formyltransferase
MRCVLFGDGAWAVETIRLLEGAGHEVAGIVLRRQPIDDALLKYARQSGRDTIQPDSVNAPDVVAWVRARTPEISVAVFYDQIIKEPLLSVAPRGFTNVHPGKLPWYRGRAAIHWALMNNESEIGVTVHLMSSRVDSGDVLVQTTVPVSFEDTYGSVIPRIRAIIPGLVFEAVDGLAAGRVVPAPQPLLGSYYGTRGPGDEWIDWTRSSLDIYNFIRALAPPGPVARTRTRDREFQVQAARYDPAWPKYRATEGQIVGLEPDGLRVKTGDSTLVITKWSEEPGGAVSPRLAVSSRFLTRDQELRVLREEVARLRRSEKT